jgi:hypothetical protein
MHIQPIHLHHLTSLLTIGFVEDNDDYNKRYTSCEKKLERLHTFTQIVNGKLYKPIHSTQHRVLFILSIFPYIVHYLLSTTIIPRQHRYA